MRLCSAAGPNAPSGRCVAPTPALSGREPSSVARRGKKTDRTDGLFDNMFDDEI
eukprot:SAG11_NODE_27365_length_333_cov_1.329060_1_plen_53_part_01